MLDVLLRMLTEFGPMASWFAMFFAAVIAVFVLYIGIALRAVLRAPDPEIHYQAFRDLLELFRPKKPSVSAGTGKSANRGRGRPPRCSRELAIRIIELRRRGLSYAQICSLLNAEQIPTPMGGSRWLKSHVDRLLHTRWVREIDDELGGHDLGPPHL
jgi:hypothetical protein